MDTDPIVAVRGRALRIGLQLLLFADIGSTGVLAASSAVNSGGSPSNRGMQSESSISDSVAAKPVGSSTNRRRSEPVRAEADPSKAKKLPFSAQKGAIAKRQSVPRRPVTGHSVAEPGGANQAKIERCRQQLEREMQPARLVKLVEVCERDLPAGPYSDELRRVAIGARSALEGQRLAGLSSDVFEDLSNDGFFRESIGKAVRGDKDAAYFLAQSFRNGRAGIVPNPRRMEQWLRFSAELGNGRASWELAEHYNYNGLVADAARFEKRALEQGYRPAARLPTRGY